MTDTPTAPTTPEPNNLMSIAAEILRATHACEKPHRNGERNAHTHIEVTHRWGQRLAALARAEARSTPAEALDRDRLFDEVDERFGRNVARFVDGRLDDLQAEARASAPLDVERLAKAMRVSLDIYGWDLDAMAEEIAAEYARLTTTDEGTPHSREADR